MKIYNLEKKNLTFPNKNIWQSNPSKNNKDIVIKKADKGSATVIMEKSNYLTEGFRQLNNPKFYKKLDAPIYPQTATKIVATLKKMTEERWINEKQFDFLAPPEIPRPRYFYLLPKIHKSHDQWPSPLMPPGRPIVSDCGSESKNVSKFIEYHLKDKANQHPSYLKDTSDFLSKIKDVDISESDLLITLDVDNMYTNIDPDDGIKAVKEVFDCSIPLYQYVVELLEISLKSNDFQFNGETYLQICGTAMGRDYAPSFANIFMAKWEKEALDKCLLKPKVFLRYLDDIFIIWQHGRQSFQEFFDNLNSHHPNIKLKSTINDNNIDFLDTTIFKNPSNRTSLMSKVYFKPTDTHQLLHKNSFHPKHTFSGIIKSQILRFYNISSRKEDFEESVQILFQALQSRHYSKRWLRKLKNDTVRIIERNLEPEEISMPGPSSGGSKPCFGPKCQTCQFVTTCENFSGLEDDIFYSITSNLDCSSRGIIYLASCDLCNKQYVGQTENPLRQRWARHKHDIANNIHSNALAKHNEEEHQLQSTFHVIPIEKVPHQGSRELDRKFRLEREQFWIDKLGTFTPHGLNHDSKKTKIKSNKTNTIPLVLPFSKTGNAAVKLIKSHYSKLLECEELEDQLPKNVVAAYTRHKNLADFLVSSKIS